MKNEKLIFFWLSFCRLVSAWKILQALNLPSTEQARTAQPKKDKFLSNFSLFLSI